MADSEAKSELGGSLMFIGLALWVADLLVVFYLPAATKLGRHGMFAVIIAVLALIGLILIMAGYGLRRKTQAS